MEINGDIEGLMGVFGVCGGAMFNDEITTYNRYLGRLYELKFELEDALDECNNEINKIQKERKPF